MPVAQINELILQNCPNYGKIIDASFQEEDNLSAYLIDYYQTSIFEMNINDDSEKRLYQSFDEAMNCFIEDYSFRKMLEQVENDLQDKIHMVPFINELYLKYKQESSKKINMTQWI